MIREKNMIIWKKGNDTFEVQKTKFMLLRNLLTKDIFSYCPDDTVWYLKKDLFIQASNFIYLTKYDTEISENMEYILKKIGKKINASILFFKDYFFNGLYRKEKKEDIPQLPQITKM